MLRIKKYPQLRVDWSKSRKTLTFIILEFNVFVSCSYSILDTQAIVNELDPMIYHQSFSTDLYVGVLGKTARTPFVTRSHGYTSI